MLASVSPDRFRGLLSITRLTLVNTRDMKLARLSRLVDTNNNDQCFKQELPRIAQA